MTDDRLSRIKVRIEQKDYDLVGSDFQQLLTAVKALPERRFNGGLKLWEITGSFEMARGQLENSGFTLEGGTPVSPEEQKNAPIANNDTIKVEIGGYFLLVSGDSFRTMLDVIKAVPGRRFDGDKKQWSLPASIAEMKRHFEKAGLKLEAQPGQPALPDLDQTALPTAPDDTPPPFSDDTFAGSASPPPPMDVPPLDDFVGFFEGEDEQNYDTILPPNDDFTPSDMLGNTPSPPVEPSAKSSSSRRDQIRVMVGNTPMVVVGGSFQEMLAAVKDIPGRRFDMESKQWLLEDDSVSIQQHLEAKGFQLVA